MRAECPSGRAMRLLLSLPVLVVALWMVSEGPAPAQASPDIAQSFKDIPQKLKEFEHSVKEKAREVADHIKKSDIPAKTRNWFSDTFKKLKAQVKDTFS
ncbi:apolipoprotein C-I isoform X2 [Dasypus novemcinctus]|uniref:apolipoprotein C-I isoform X2 n=1 Tax=Dasypus novemcinctus TaxID=9361 RepID=UPI00265F8CD9|nr:apolipoprotein C-I isoform X2 [Dasypus novemcinctus]